MPIYDFRNKTTGEVSTLNMSISAMEQYKIDHPEMERYYGDTMMNIGDPVRLGVTKLDGGFREVLGRISRNVPGAKGLKDQIR